MDEGQYFLFEQHIERLESSAIYFGFVWNKEAVRSALARTRANRPSGCWKVRLLVARDGAISIEIHELALEDKTWRVAFAPEPIHSQDIFIFHNLID
ncbi:MAG: aminotransferase class IV [Acidobacteria bacterium]|nr:aminotransferase class IV [Acidobacteriota bacterium]